MALALLVVDASARAHHPPPADTTAPVPRSRLALELAAGEVPPGVVAAEGASWRAMTVAFEAAFLGRFSIETRLPLAHARYADGAEVAGPGDMEIDARALLASTRLATMVVSLGVGLPTAERGLGDEHVALTPLALAALRPVEHLSCGASLAAHVGVDTEKHDRGAHGSVLAPHEDHELYPRVWLGADAEGLFAQLGAELALVLEDDHDLLGPLTLQGDAGVHPSDRTRLAVRVQLPAAGPERLDWRAGLGVEYQF